MDIEKKLELLKKLSRVDAPAFLLTGIKERIRQTFHEPAPVRWKMAFTALAIVVLIVNIIAVARSEKQAAGKGPEVIFRAMQLSSSNEFYYEQN